MAAAPNFKGKSSILEIITLCLRGTPRELQNDVAAWLRIVECDLSLGADALGIRLTLHGGDIVSATVHQAAALAALPDTIANSTAIIDAQSGPQYAADIEALMLDRLDLEPLHASDRRTGLQVHGWPSYFGAIYPPAGGDKVLIGETPMAGLAGRLLGVFLDLPRAAVLTRVKTALAAIRADKERDRAAVSPTRRDEIRSEHLGRLDEAERALAGLDGPGPSAVTAAAHVSDLSAQLATAQRQRSELAEECRMATVARQRDQRMLDSAQENVVAARLFHGLDPTMCPRCEAPVSLARRTRETHHHECAVCATPLDAPGAEDTDEELLADRQRALDASTAAERALGDHLAHAAAEVTHLTVSLTQAEDVLESAQAARQASDRATLEDQISRARGALEALDAMQEDPPAVAQDHTAIVLPVLADELEKDMKAAAAPLLNELSTEITELAHSFGINALTDTTVNLAGVLRIEKGGAAASSFGSQSPGERLRLRIATVVALLRVGQRRGIATHPGLLLFDSLRAEEVQDSDARALLQALAMAAAETDNLQMIVTTQDDTLAAGLLTDDHLITVDDHGNLW